MVIGALLSDMGALPGLLLRRAKLIDRLAPQDMPRHIRAKVFAGNACFHLDDRAQLGRYWAMTAEQLADELRTLTNRGRQRGTAAFCINCASDGFVHRADYKALLYAKASIGRSAHRL